MKKILFFILLFLSIYPKKGVCHDEKSLEMKIGESNYLFYVSMLNRMKVVDKILLGLNNKGFEFFVKNNTDYTTFTSIENTFVQDLDKVVLLSDYCHKNNYSGYFCQLPFDENFDCLNQSNEKVLISGNRVEGNVGNIGVKNSVIFDDITGSLLINSKDFVQKSQCLGIASMSSKENFIFDTIEEDCVLNDETNDKINGLFSSGPFGYIKIQELKIGKITGKIIFGVVKSIEIKQMTHRMYDFRKDFCFLKGLEENKNRIISDNNFKMEDEITEKLEKEKENLTQDECKKDDQLEREEIAKKNKNKVGLEINIEAAPTEILRQIVLDEVIDEKEIEFGDLTHNCISYLNAKSRVKSVKNREKTNNGYFHSIQNLEYPILEFAVDLKTKKDNNWKTTNKIFLGTSLVCFGVFSNYFVHYIKAKNDLSVKQKLADPDGDSFVFLSRNLNNNKVYSDYLFAYEKLGAIKEKGQIYNGILIGGAIFGTAYLVQKIREKQKPSDLKLVVFNKGFCLSYKI